MCGNQGLYYSLIKNVYTVEAKQLPLPKEVYNQLPASLKLLAWHCLPEDASAFEAYLIGKHVNVQTKASMLWFQDYTGVPEITNLAAKRDALAKLGKDPSVITAQVPTHLVFDHSVRTKGSLAENLADETRLNFGRIRIAKWAGEQMGITIIPPNKGVIHQINTEKLVPVFDKDGVPVFGKGTDSHTPMVNANCILAWGIGGSEAQKVFAGERIGMKIPKVVAINLINELPIGISSSDLCLALKPILRKIDVTGAFVQFIGEGVNTLPLEARATIANVAAEFGSRVALFMVDDETVKFLSYSDRDRHVESLSKSYGLWRNEENEFNVSYSQTEIVDLSTMQRGVSGPNTPHNWVPLSEAHEKVKETFAELSISTSKIYQENETNIPNGALLLASIASCTHTANPDSILRAALLAKRAVKKGLSIKPWVKTAFASGSKVADQYLEALELKPYIEQLGFGITAYGCGACIGQSGGLNKIGDALLKQGFTPTSVVSSNRNYAGRQDASVSLSFLAAPDLIIAYAIAGRIDIDITSYDFGDGVYLKDLLPSHEEVAEAKAIITKDMHQTAYEDLFEGTESYNAIEFPSGPLYDWQDDILVKKPPFFVDLTKDPAPIVDVKDARVLGIFGNDFSTDAISPAGNPTQIPAAMDYLHEHGVFDLRDILSIGGYRSNTDLLSSTIFSNPTNQNLMVEQKGGWTKYYPSGEELSIYIAAQRYKSENVPLIVIGGINYGCGSSRVMAASGPYMLGVKSVIAESYEAIHRSNLWQMGIVPLCFMEGENAETFGIDGSEVWEIPLSEIDENTDVLNVSFIKSSGETIAFQVRVALESPQEYGFLQHGGVMQQQLREMAISN